ncbi:MAG: hypothetical protein H0V17_07390 [Deltaproteobacteria bacterium]|nr:hypothetical protein [Deltaproteobacteria bacterium]
MFAAVLSACAGGGDDPPTPDAGTNPNTPVCGDGTCAAAEVNVCSQDCGSTATPVCGNGTCENGENTGNCASDCNTGVPVCGDATCDMAGGENSTNCPGDCGGSTGSLDCEAQETLLGCFGCILDPTTCAAPFTEADCNACFGGA